MTGLAPPPAPRSRPAVSTIALIAANSVPLLGAIFLGWRVFPILLIYWLENVTVGAFNVLRMLAAKPDNVGMWVGKVFLIPYFCFHYGVFTAVHGLFIFTVFGPHIAGDGGFWPTASAVSAAVHENDIGFAVFALVMSHAVSFVWNYLIGGEFRRVTPSALMTRPYGRVMVLHVVIIGGAAATAALGSPLAALLVLVAIKATLDVVAHRRERSKLAGGAEGTGQRSAAG